MTNPTTTTQERQKLIDEIVDIKLDYYTETKGGELRMDVTRTVANIFGAREDDVDQLCWISDLAANVRFSLDREDWGDVLDELQITASSFLADFVEWKWS